MAWVRVGEQAINLDHVTEARWEAGGRKLLLVTDAVQTTSARVAGEVTETARVFRAVEIEGEAAEEVWAWLGAQGPGAGPGRLSLLPGGRKGDG